MFLVVDFFNRINLIYGTVCDYCSDKSCPKMSGGPRFEYLWADGMEYKKPTPLSAPKYVSLLMDWIESQINNEKTFPTSVGKYLESRHFRPETLKPRNFKFFRTPRNCKCDNFSENMTRRFIYFSDSPFPKNFVSVCRKILTRLFRVFVHVYIHHFDRIVALGAEAHVNTCYKHFYYFINEFNLISAKELEPLKEMTEKICPT